MRAIAATNALSIEVDIAKVQEWLGHALRRLHDADGNRQSTERVIGSGG